MRKLIIYLCCYLFNFISTNAQEIKLNEETKRGEFVEVVQVSNLKQDVLFERVHLWLNKQYKNPKSVIQKIDSLAFTINGKHQIQLYNDVKGVKVQKGFMRYSFEIICKDGRYKYRFFNINPTTETSYVDFTNWIKKPENAKFEKEINDFIIDKINTLKTALSTEVVKKNDDW